MTAYTKFIEDGTVTTAKDFLKLCSRNFGVYAVSKDEPLSPDIPVTIEKDPKYQKAVDDAKAILDEALHCDDWEQELTEKKQNVSDEIEAIKTKNEELTEIYATIRAEIVAWTPEAPYDKVKDFAINQIDISVKFLPSTEKLEKEFTKLEEYTADEYKDIVIKKLSEDLAAAIVENMKADQLVAKRQVYLDGFWDSIEDL